VTNATITIAVPVQSSTDDQKANHGALEKAMAITPTCRATLTEAQGELTLTIPR
jgi:hypothetical protein